MLSDSLDLYSRSPANVRVNVLLCPESWQRRKVILAAPRCESDGLRWPTLEGPFKWSSSEQTTQQRSILAIYQNHVDLFRIVEDLQCSRQYALESFETFITAIVCQRDLPSASAHPRTPTGWDRCFSGLSMLRSIASLYLDFRLTSIDLNSDPN